MSVRYAASGIAVASALLVATDAVAHHSFAPHFDSSKPVSISGTITEFEAQNPHSYVHIAAVDENGRTQKYVCESHGVTQLTRNGVTPQVLKVGTKIRVTGSLSRHSPYMCFFNTVELPDGRVLNVNGPTGPRPATAALPARKDIFGTWMLAPIANRSTSGPQPMIQLMTPAGEKAVAAYDPFKDDPTFRCDPVAIRRVWGAPGTPLEIVRDGNDVVLRHEWMDVRRVIHMNMKEHPKNGPRGSLGHSIGRWEGDTLVIETGNYSAGVLNQYVEQPGQPTRGPAPLRRADVGGAAASRRRAPASRRSRSISPIRNSSSSRSSARRTSTRRQRSRSSRSSARPRDPRARSGSSPSP